MPYDHADRAIRALHDYLKPTAIGDGTGIEAFLRAYETRAGLDANTLPNPIGYERAQLLFDTRSPLLMMFDTDWVPNAEGGGPGAGSRNNLWDIEATLVWEWTSDARVGSHSGDLMRASMLALKNAIRASSSLGGRVNNCVVTDGSAAFPLKLQQSELRHVRAMGVRITVQDGVG